MILVDVPFGWRYGIYVDNYTYEGWRLTRRWTHRAAKRRAAQTRGAQQ